MKVSCAGCEVKVIEIQNKGSKKEKKKINNPELDKARKILEMLLSIS